MGAQTSSYSQHPVAPHVGNKTGNKYTNPGNNPGNNAGNKYSNTGQINQTTKDLNPEKNNQTKNKIEHLQKDTPPLKSEVKDEKPPLNPLRREFSVKQQEGKKSLWGVDGKLVHVPKKKKFDNISLDMDIKKDQR